VRENQTRQDGVPSNTRFVIPDLAADTHTLKSQFGDLEQQPARAVKGCGGVGGEVQQEAVGGESAWWPARKRWCRTSLRYSTRGQNLYVSFDVYDAAPEPADPHARRMGIRESQACSTRKGVKGSLKQVRMHATGVIGDPSAGCPFRCNCRRH